MCLIGLLLPFRHEKHSRKYSSTNSDHRSSPQRGLDSRSPERRRSDHRTSDHKSSHHRSLDPRSPDTRRDSSHRRRSDHRSSDRRSSDNTSSGHRRSEHSRRDGSRRKGEDEFKDLSRRTEDAIARLCVSLEQSFIEEQRSWREQERLDRLERCRLGLDGLDRGLPPPEEVPPYSLMDENPRQPPPGPQAQTGAADGRECHNNGGRNRDSVGWAYCCRSCVCARCGSATVNCPPLPELDGTRPRPFTASGVDSRR